MADTSTKTTEIKRKLLRLWGEGRSLCDALRLARVESHPRRAEFEATWGNLRDASIAIAFGLCTVDQIVGK